MDPMAMNLQSLLCFADSAGMQTNLCHVEHAKKSTLSRQAKKNLEANQIQIIEPSIWKSMRKSNWNHVSPQFMGVNLKKNPSQKHT